MDARLALAYVGVDMARPGQVIEIPATGERFVFLKTARETDGELLQLEFFVNPGGFAPVSHIHTDVEERVRVIAGRASIKVGGKEQVLGPGESGVFPMRKSHTFAAEGEEQLHMLVDVLPARDFETLFETVFGYYREGKSDPHGHEPLLASVMLARTHHSYLPGPPILLQRLALTLASPISWAMGYRARHEKYSGPED